jgi:hypothetical protein
MQGPGHYEQLAKEHRMRADRIADAELKRSVLEIAKNYEAMAERMRRGPTLIPTKR